MKLTDLTEEEMALVLEHRANKEAIMGPSTVYESEKDCEEPPEYTGKLKKRLYFGQSGDTAECSSNIEHYLDLFEYFVEKDKELIENDIIKIVRKYFESLGFLDKGTKFKYEIYDESWSNSESGYFIYANLEEGMKKYFDSITAH